MSDRLRFTDGVVVIPAEDKVFLLVLLVAAVAAVEAACTFFCGCPAPGVES